MTPRIITNLDSLQTIVKLGQTHEDECIEFKREVNISGRSPDGRKLPDDVVLERKLEFCCDVSQFANTDGGCLLIGVSETSSPIGKVAGEFVGVQNAETLRQQIEQTLSAFTIPSTFRRTVIPVDISEGITVLAINVVASERPVFVWNQQAGWMKCYRRSSHGKVAQNPDQLEELLMDASRTARLRLGRLLTDPARRVIIHSGVWREGAPLERGNIAVILDKEHQAFVSHLSESEFTLLLSWGDASLSINIPYGFVEEAWKDVAGIATLSLSRKIMLSRDTRLFLERRPEY